MRCMKFEGAAYCVSLLPGAILLAGTDDCLHEVALWLHPGGAHLTVKLQRSAPLPVYIAGTYDGAPCAGSQRFLAIR